MINLTFGIYYDRPDDTLMGLNTFHGFFYFVRLKIGYDLKEMAVSKRIFLPFLVYHSKHKPIRKNADLMSMSLVKL